MILGLDIAPARIGLVFLTEKWSGQVDEYIHIFSFTPQGSHLIAKAEHAVVKLMAQAHLFHPERIYVEDYPLGNNSKGTRERAEFTGIIKHALWYDNANWLPIAVNISSARKTLLGKVPQGKGLAKKVCFESLKSLGFQLTCDDEADALVVANHGASLLDRSFITALEQPTRG